MPGSEPRAETPGPIPTGEAADRYEIVGRLADGAMGQVYLARLTEPGHAVSHLVLKRIRPELQTDPDIVLMFRDEARIAAQMDHPNIVRLYEVGELDGSLFLAMELVEGITVEHLLSTLVEARRFIPVELALTVATGVLNALDYAHRFADGQGRPLNIVHRDVSPQNLMVTYAGEVKLLDFGVTRAEGRLHETLPGLLKGKLAYMPPEMIQGRSVDARADLFSLGAVLYELLLLKHPFFGSTDAMVIRSIVEEPPVHPAELDPQFPEPLAHILLEALAKEPAHRVASAADMRLAIQRFLAEREFDLSRATEALGRYIRELYADRIALHEHAKTVNDDAQLLKALRGFVNRASARAAETVRGEQDRDEPFRGRFAIPHSMIDLDYARVPTADLPVLRRVDSVDTDSLRRPSVDEVLDDAYTESPDDALPSGIARPLMPRLGRYQLLEVLEQSPVRLLQRARLLGAFGFAKDVTMLRLPPDRVHDPEWIAPLVREAKIRANFNHPHVESLIDFDDQPEAHFIVEPLEGARLDQVLTATARGHRARPRLDVALRVALDIVEALEYLHTLPEPVVHRAVEPAAVHVHSSGRSKLSGFHAARLLDGKVPDVVLPRLPSIDRLAPESVAPEIGPEGPATDVYGVTLLLAECLTLARPFLRDEPSAVAQAILHGVDDSLLQDLPRALRPVVSRGLTAVPAERFPQMSALRDALLHVGPVAPRAAVRAWLENG